MVYLFDSYDRVYFEVTRPYVTKPPAPSSKARDIQERSFEDLEIEVGPQLEQRITSISRYLSLPPIKDSKAYTSKKIFTPVVLDPVKLCLYFQGPVRWAADYVRHDWIMGDHHRWGLVAMYEYLSVGNVKGA